jgi:hypothetical protein
MKVQAYFKRRSFVGKRERERETKAIKSLLKSDLSTSVDCKPNSQNSKEGSDNVLAKQKSCLISREAAADLRKIECMG